MEIEKVFRMKGGLGENSYSNNSGIQKSVQERVRPILLETLEEVYLALRPKSLGIADLGCGTGRNALSNIEHMVNAVEKATQSIQESMPEFHVCLNDLPTNDFNTVFGLLPDFYRKLKKERNNGDLSIYLGAYPGNYYGRLFPTDSLYFRYSFNCLHWLSKVPPDIYDEQGMSLNKRGIYICKNSPPQVCEAYAKQFQEDLSLFLQSRSEEIVTGGRMILTFSGRNSLDPYDKDRTFAWELLHCCLHNLVLQEEKVESYNIHYYAPSKEEVEDAVKKEGSFKLERLELVAREMNEMNDKGIGQVVAKTVRAVQESLHVYHFGDDIMDDLFDEYAILFSEHVVAHGIRTFDIVLILKKM